MSRINQALHELDQRAPAAAPAFAAHATGPSAPLARRGRATWRLAVIVVAGGAAIAAVAGGDLGAFGGTSAAPTPVFRSAMPSAEPTPPVSAVVNLVAAPAVLPPVVAQELPPSALPARAAVFEGPRTARIEAAPVATPQASPPPSPSVAPTLSASLSLQVPLALPARIDRRAAVAPAARAGELWQAAVALVNSGQRQAALLKLREVLALEPGHTQARQLCAVLEQEFGAIERAITLLHEGLALPGRQPELAVLLARLQAAQGHADEALATLARHAPEGAESDGLRAGLWAQRGDFQQALPLYERALRRQPANAVWWAGLAVALESIGQPGRARQAYAQARGLGIEREDLASYVEQRLRALE